MPKIIRTSAGRTLFFLVGIFLVLAGTSQWSRCTALEIGCVISLSLIAIGLMLCGYVIKSE